MREEKRLSMVQDHPKKEHAHRKGNVLSALATLLVLALLLAGIVYHSIDQGKREYELRFYQMVSDRVSRNIRFVLISDLHLREYGEDNIRLIADVSALKPDVILLGGDLVTYNEDSYDNMLSLCGKLAGIAPVYGVMGNHEDEKIFLDNDSELSERFAATGVTILRNRAETLEIGDDRIELVGVSGNASGFEKYGGRECMEGLSEEYEGFRVVMAHIPTLFPDALQDYAFDLGVAGHTHGGVVRLPKFGGLYSAEEGFLPTYCGGKYALDNGGSLVVSRGMGSSGKIPRVFNLPELVVIDVNWY